MIYPFLAALKSRAQSRKSKATLRSSHMRRRILRAAAVLLGLFLVLGLAGGLYVRAQLRASLPQLDGTLRVNGLSAPVTIERDGLGIPTVRGASREDVARAIGTLHAQERFFEMDLSRRRAAGWRGGGRG